MFVVIDLLPPKLSKRAFQGYADNSAAVDNVSAHRRTGSKKKAGRIDPGRPTGQ
jgi:hypothetical protein